MIRVSDKRLTTAKNSSNINQDIVAEGYESIMDYIPIISSVRNKDILLLILIFHPYISHRQRGFTRVEKINSYHSSILLPGILVAFEGYLQPYRKVLKKIEHSFRYSIHAIFDFDKSNFDTELVI